MLLLTILTVLLSCWSSVFAANVTVDDTDPSIVYSPVASWHPSSSLCQTCLNPGTNVSFHEGIHPNIGDVGPTSSSTSPLPQASNPGRRALARQLGSGFVDTLVTLSFNFTGTAIYMYCIKPLGENPVDSNATPTNMNLSFTIDNQLLSHTFFSTGTPGTTGFSPNTNVMSLSGLSDQPHQLVVYVGDDSVLLFDHLVYTDGSVGNSTSATALPTSTTSPAFFNVSMTSMPMPTEKTINKNVATFAGAIGGTVGVLSLFSLGIAISIIRRRMLAARRERLDDEANSSNNPAPMIGPQLFVPRYFPDTVVPTDPPTYIDALSTANHNSAPLLSSEYSSRQRSYADIPPASPPPLLEELPPLPPLEELPPPPPFPVALSAPIVEMPPPDATSPSISTANQTTDSPDSEVEASGPSNFSSLESSPLLQPSSDADMRPHSPTSRTSIAPLESPEIPDANHDDEDAS